MEIFEGQNWSLLSTIKIIPLSGIAFSKFQNPLDFDQIHILEGENFTEIPHIFESAGFRETEKLTDAGTCFSKTVFLSIPKLREEVSLLLKNYENRLLALLITDHNHITHLVYPLRMLRRRNIPGMASGLNATTLEFSGQWHSESPVVRGVI